MKTKAGWCLKSFVELAGLSNKMQQMRNQLKQNNGVINAQIQTHVVEQLIDIITCLNSLILHMDFTVHDLFDHAIN